MVNSQLTNERRLSAATLLTLLLSLCILIVTIVNIIITSIQQDKVRTDIAFEQVKSLGLLAASGSSNGVIFEQRELIERACSGIEGLSGFQWVIVRNLNGDTLYTKKFDNAPASFQQGGTLMPQTLVRSIEAENNSFIVAAPVLGAVENDRRGEILFAISMQSLEAAMNRSLYSMIFTAVGASLIMSFFGFFVVKFMGLATRRHVEVASLAAKGDLTHRVSENFSILTPKEAAIIRRSFNRMLDSLEQHDEEMNLKNQRLQEATDRLTAMNAALDARAQELAQKNIQIEKQNDELKTLNTEKNEFLGIVAHDLKNPISAFRGLAEVLHLNDVEPETVKKIGGVMINSAEKMFELVSNLLDINQLERGGRKYDLQPINIVWTLNAVLESYLHKAEQKNITIDYTLPERSVICFADSLATTQILDNLVSNAVKYSPQGTTVHVTINEKAESVVIGVRDEGPGLSDDDKSKLFGKFARLSAQPTGGEHSTGLGLSIAKAIVEAMHGKVWCESVLGKGATFFVEFPRKNLSNQA